MPVKHSAGIYVAREKGWYSGLEVVCLSPHVDGYKATPGSRCKSGEAQFAVSASCWLQACQQTAPLNCLWPGCAQRDLRQLPHTERAGAARQQTAGASGGCPAALPASAELCCGHRLSLQCCSKISPLLSRSARAASRVLPSWMARRTPAMVRSCLCCSVNHALDIDTWQQCRGQI